MEYVNQSIFIIPIRVDNYSEIRKSFDNCKDWKLRNLDSIKPSYLFPYAERIIKDENLFFSFSYDGKGFERLYTYKKWLNLLKHPILSEINFSLFSTRIGFLEYRFKYDKEVSINDVLEFSYWFKKAKPKKEWIDSGTIGLYDFSIEIMPSSIGYDLFFTNSADFKYDCKCFHTIKIKKDSLNEEQVNEALHRLSRNYNSTFGIALDIGENDMIYCPYSYNRWSGSPEAVANLVFDDIDSDTSRFINGNMYLQIQSDHYFMYLLLLNQRFSLLNYLEEVSKYGRDSKKQLEDICKQSIVFNSIFSFRVISDDLLYQTIYSKMYSLLDIQKLKEDTEDNERIANALLTSQTVKAEENVSKLLFGLSFLSLFSALIDASGFFDRVIASSKYSTILSLICVSLIFIISVYKTFKSK